jgi:hypothetical protein
MLACAPQGWRVEQAAGLVAHEVGGLDLDEGLGNRKLHALVLPDGSPEHHALLGVGRDAVDEPVAVADAFRRDQRALGVEPVQDVPEALAFLADEVPRRDLEVLEEQLVGLVVHHVQDGLHREPLADGLAQVDDEDRHAFGLLLHVRQRRGARQQDHQVRMLDARDPHLLPVDDVAVALLHGRGLDPGGVGAGGGLGDAHRLQAQFAAGDPGQVLALLRLAAVTQQRAHVVHLAVAGAGVAAAAVDFFHDHRGLGQAQAGAAVFLRDQRGHPAGLGERVDEFGGVAARLVDLAEVGVGKLRAQVAHRVADVGVVLVVGVVHRSALRSWRALQSLQGTPAACFVMERI